MIEEFGYPNQRFVLHANIGANNVPIVVVRESKEEDLTEILHLYLYLHEKSVPEESEQLRSTWENIMNDNSDFFQGNCLGCLYGTDNGRCILISGSGEWYCFRGIGMGKYKGNFILFCD